MKARSPIVIFGAGGHARVVADIARRRQFAVAAMVSDRAADAQQFPLVLCPEEAREKHPRAAWIVAIGDNFKRRSVVVRLARQFKGLRFATLVHPNATVSTDTSIGEGTVVMAGAVINPGTRVGDHCIVNTGACIDHDCDVHDFASLAPGVITGGKVRIGTASAIGLGATIRHGLTIGEHTVVGAGAVVLRDVPSRCTAFGVPCRVIRPRTDDEPYL